MKGQCHCELKAIEISWTEYLRNTLYLAEPPFALKKSRWEFSGESSRRRQYYSSFAFTQELAAFCLQFPQNVQRDQMLKGRHFERTWVWTATWLVGGGMRPRAGNSLFIAAGKLQGSVHSVNRTHINIPYHYYVENNNSVQSCLFTHLRCIYRHDAMIF